MDEQTTTTIYEPPALVELGEFGEDTLGGAPFQPNDFLGGIEPD